MTNVFPNAPDRIWATWKEDFGAVQIGTWADTVRFEPLGVEYIRADLAAADAAKLAEIRAFIADQTRHNCGLVRTLREMLE